MESTCDEANHFTSVAIDGVGLRFQGGKVSQGGEAVKEVVTQPFNTLDSAKDSLQENQDKQKAAFQEADKENK